MAVGSYGGRRFRDPYEAEEYVARMEREFAYRQEMMARELDTLRRATPMFIDEKSLVPKPAAPKAPAPTRSKLLLLL